MTELRIELIPAFRDNYLFLLRAADDSAVGIVDPGDAAPVEARLATLGLSLTHIFVTHHHPDHIGGLARLRDRTAAQVIGPASETQRIAGIDIGVADGDQVAFAGHVGRVIAVPGHTRGHVAYHFAAESALFCGDTLFALGCGRTFEGTAEQMWASLSALRRLPDATRVYCAHEYTEANARFALTVEPDNAELVARAAEIDALRAAGQATVPSTIGLERRTNPFLRADQPAIRQRMGLLAAPDHEVFGAIRAAKDVF